MLLITPWHGGQQYAPNSKAHAQQQQLSCRYIFNCCLFVFFPLSRTHYDPLNCNLFASCRCDNVLRVLGSVPCPAAAVPVRPGVGTLQNSQRVAFHVWRDPLLRIMVSEVVCRSVEKGIEWNGLV